MAWGTEVRPVLTRSIARTAVTPRNSTGTAVAPPQATHLAIDTSHRKKKTKIKKKIQEETPGISHGLPSDSPVQQPQLLSNFAK